MSKYVKVLIDTRKTINHHMISKLYLEGLEPKEIATKLNIKYGSITYSLNMQKVSRRKRATVGDKNSNWKGGFMFDRKRKMIYSPNHPFAKSIGRGKTPYVYEYRLIMEKKLGRYLTKKEIVHHIDGDVTNNSEENLEVTTQSEHARKHSTEMHARNKTLKNKGFDEYEK